MARGDGVIGDGDGLVFRGVEVAPGEACEVRIDIARLPTGTLIDLPVYVRRGERPGPVLLVQGGLHGDEVNGIEICRRLLVDGLAMPEAGATLVVPVLNVFGFINFSRELPDGKDVNRSFPGRASGSLASRVAWHVVEDLLPVVDMAVDLHTGGGRRHNHPQVRYTADMAASRELAEAFGAPLWFPSKRIRRSFRDAAYKRDIPVVVYEGGESLRFDEHAIQQGIEGVRRVMAHLGMVESAPPPGPSRHLDTTRWVRAPRSGLFRAFVSAGDEVTKGEVIGEISDPYGTSIRRLRASGNGVVACLNHSPAVNRGDALLRIGRSEAASRAPL